MLHHISIGVSDITRAGEFYDAVLLPLGYFRVWEDLRPGEQNQAIGYGTESGNDKLTLKERFADNLAAGPGFHLALTAPSREAVENWHSVGLRLGAIDQGAPKIWEEYGSDYFAAYLMDLDGWQLEAVCKLDSAS